MWGSILDTLEEIKMSLFPHLGRIWNEMGVKIKIHVWVWSKRVNMWCHKESVAWGSRGFMEISAFYPCQKAVDRWLIDKRDQLCVCMGERDKERDRKREIYRKEDFENNERLENTLNIFDIILYIILCILSG